MPRVLLAGFSERNKYFGNFFYATLHKLRNGFIRAGSHVIWFSDRDIADYHAPLFIRPLGATVANAKLITLVERTEPDVLCLMHTDLITDGTVAKLRRLQPHMKILTVYLDPLSDGRLGSRFERFASLSDASFATTAGPDLAQFRKFGSVGFVPNPIDLSVERVCSFEGTEHDHDFFFAGKPKGRDGVLQELQALLPSRHFGIYLQTGKAMALSGAAYPHTLGRSRIAVAAGVPNDWKWYASDRIAQYFGAGCLVAQPVLGDLGSLYGADSLLLYRDARNLAEQAEQLFANDDWRERARHGQANALRVSDTAIVATYLLDRAFSARTFEWPAWAAEFYPRST